MCHPDVVIRPHRARASAEAVEYRGHEGVRDWVGSLDADTRITLDVFDIDVTGPQSAVIGTDVWLEKGDARTGGPTWSVWRFEDSKLREAIGFESKSEALDAEAARG